MNPSSNLQNPCKKGRKLDIVVPVTAPELGGIEEGVLGGLVGHQPNSRVSERSCLKGTRQRALDRDHASC